PAAWSADRGDRVIRFGRTGASSGVGSPHRRSGRDRTDAARQRAGNHRYNCGVDSATDCEPGQLSPEAHPHHGADRPSQERSKDREPTCCQTTGTIGRRRPRSAIDTMEIVSYKAEAHCPQLQRIKSRSLQMNPELIARVAAIVDAVRAGGDEALIHFTQEHDGVKLTPADIRVSPEIIEAAADRADPLTVAAFVKAIANVRAFHDLQTEPGWTMEGEFGCKLGLRVLPIASTGLYVPGGRAAYPSSLIMNAVPAQVAGVRRIAVTTPPRNLERTPVVAAVLKKLNIQEVYQVGGAQAIAALAFGTETIPRVDKIVGPGNVYVAIAKKLVYGSVGIDSIAGPTEIVVLADESANPAFVAADLLAQAEHDREASAVCITPSAKLGREVAREVERRLAGLDRNQIAGASLERYGAIFIVGSLKEGCDLVNLIAPEHLELMTANNDETLQWIENAGAIFFGDWSSEPVGDYLAGPNHVLPTLGTSRFSSPLGVYDFVKRQSIIRYSREALIDNASLISAMADAEGLTAHKQAVMERVMNDKRDEG